MFEQQSVMVTTSDANAGSPSASSTHDLLERLVTVATAAAGNDRTDAKETLEKALAMLMSFPASAKIPVGIPSRGGLAPWQARRVADYIREHIGTCLRAGGLAALVRLSSSHFHRAFKVSFNETPTSYVLRQHIRVAQAMMLTTAHSLAQIALECGLCDQAHLSRLFRRFVGESPRLWRRQHAFDLAPLAGTDNLSH